MAEPIIQPAPQEPPSTGPQADTDIRTNLRGTLLGKLLHPDDEPDKPLFERQLNREAEEKKPKDAAKPEDKAKPDEKPEKKTTIETEKPRSEEETPPEEPEPKKPAAKKRAVKPEPKTQLSREDLGNVASTAAHAAVATQVELERQRKAQADVQDLPEEVAQNLPIYAELHRSNPSKYPPNLHEKVAKFVKDELQYADKWEKENSGQEFDSEAEEHQEWYQKNQPAINPSDWKKAEVRAEARKMIQEEVVPQQRQISDKMDRQGIEPKLRDAAASIGSEILRSVIPFEGEMTKEVLDKAKEDDPVAFDVAAKIDSAMAKVIYEGGLLWHGHEKFNPSDNVHNTAKAIFVELENQLSENRESLPSRGGKTWVPAQDYMKMPPGEQARHYTTEFDDMVSYIKMHAAPVMAREVYKREMTQAKSLIEALGPKLGYVRSNGGESSREEEPQRARNPMSASSPSISSGTPPSNGAPSSGRGDDFMTKFFNGMGVR